MLNWSNMVAPKLQIVKGCGGFPLALDVVGRSLCGRRKEIWKHVLKQWSEGQSIFESKSNNDLLTCLQTSLNTLVWRYKECYLDLASFPEDQRIPATALMDMWVELYNLDENGEDAIAILDELSNRSLVEQVIIRYCRFLTLYWSIIYQHGMSHTLHYACAYW